MEIIAHRRNTIELLNSTPFEYGIEVDLRSLGKDLIINHDPFKLGTKFSSWIKNYNHGTLIINVKEDGLEEEIIFYLKKYSINSFFFLDQSMPSIIRTSSNGINNCATRVSEYESVENALKLKNQVKWIWVDMFKQFPINYQNFIDLKKAKFKLCLVSPELQINNKLNIELTKKILVREKISFDAVCTKYPESWKQII